MIVEFRRQRRAADRRREAGVRMGRFLGRQGPRPPLPVECLRGGGVSCLPRGVRSGALEMVSRWIMSNAVGFVLRWCRATRREPGFRFTAERLPFSRPYPRDVVADGPCLPVRHRWRRHDIARLVCRTPTERLRNVTHRPVTLAAAEDEHVLGEPSFVARLMEGASMPCTLPGALRQYPGRSTRRCSLPEMDNEAAIGAQIAERMQAVRRRNHRACRAPASARHDAHVQHVALSVISTPTLNRRSGGPIRNKPRTWFVPSSIRGRAASAWRAHRRAPSSYWSARCRPAEWCR